MTSTVPSGTPGNSLSRPRAYEMMIGSAMRKPRIQPGSGSAQADSMIGGPDDRHRDVAPVLGERHLAERLGIGVGVGPPERGGTGAAGVDQLGLHPVLAALLGLGGEQRGAGGAELVTGRGGDLVERSGVRLSASASARTRRAPSTSRRQSMSFQNGLSSTRTSAAAPRRLPAT